MTGAWKLEGKVMGQEAHHEVRAEWVLNHQFLNLRERTSAAAPPSERRYEATWFFGYDPVSERYVVHLFDVFGARFSETLGYGTRDGNSIHVVFEYPASPFHTRTTGPRRRVRGNGRWSRKIKLASGRNSPTSPSHGHRGEPC
jgi:hypothetical protein